MRLVVLDADATRVRFEAACHRIGEGEARRAFSMALNKEGRKAYTAHRRALVKQTSIPRPVVTAAMRFDSARRNRLETRITGTGRHLPLSVFKPRQFSYGVRAKAWGRPQTYRSAFMVKRLRQRGVQAGWQGTAADRKAVGTSGAKRDAA